MRGRALLILLALGLTMALVAAPVAAASLTVNSLADTAPADDGSCTLREAITAANTNTASGASLGECAAGSGADSISFSVSGTITLTAFLPDITSDLSIAGAGAITINGAGAFQGLGITAGTVTVSGITITNGSFAAGGGILIDDGTLTLNDSTISGNTGGAGGGIYNTGGNVTINNSIITSNGAGGGGGGILTNGANLIINNSIISGNTGGGGGSGGGILITGSSTATVTNSTITGNSAEVGGGIMNEIGGTVSVLSSTISGNTSLTNGGGIFNQGALTVTNSTISGNTASEGGGITNWFNSTATVTNATISGNTASGGGGIAAVGTETVVNSIIAGNSAPVGPDIDNIAETITTSVIGVPGGKTLADILVTAGLANNGGPTQTIALAQVAGNPAIDTGTSAVCSAPPINGLDQRGLPRPAACDIGAYEVQPAPVASSLPNAAIPEPGPMSGWTTLGFGVLLIGALGAVVLMNARGARARR